MKITEVLKEAEHQKTITVHYGVIPGGRAGNEYNAGTFEMPITVKDYEDAMERGDIPDLQPNDGNVARLIKTVTTGKMFASIDHYGEGMFAISTKKDGLKLRVLELYHTGE